MTYTYEPFTTAINRKGANIVSYFIKIHPHHTTNKTKSSLMPYYAHIQKT